MVCGDIDHPSAGKHEGHVYVSTDDVAKGQVLSAGDIVSFYLYADEKGLGAEEVCVEEHAAPQFNLYAAEIVPSFLNVDAEEFVPAMSPKSRMSLNVDAEVYVPSTVAKSFNVEATEAEDAINVGAMSKVFARLSHVFMSDDDDSDEESDGVSLADNSSVEGTDGCSSDIEHLRNSRWNSMLDEPRKAKTSSESQDGSTSAGTASDSDDDNSLCDATSAKYHTMSFVRGRFRVTIRLPANFSPPPGLALVGKTLS